VLALLPGLTWPWYCSTSRRCGCSEHLHTLRKIQRIVEYIAVPVPGADRSAPERAWAPINLGLQQHGLGPLSTEKELIKIFESNLGNPNLTFGC